MEYWYFVTGPKHWLDLHETHMQSQLFYIPGIAPTGQTFQQGMNGILEPIKLFRFIFPREGLPIVMNTLGNGLNRGLKLNTAGIALRKLLGLKEIPKVPNSSIIKLNASMDFLNIIPLGIKDDGPDRIMETTGVKQELI